MARVLYPTSKQWEQLMAILGGDACLVIVSPEAQQQLKADPRNASCVGGLPDCPDDYDWSDPALYIDWVFDSDSFGYEQLLGTNEDEYEEDDEDDEQEDDEDEEKN